MPRRNRVTPWGAIEASAARGTLMGNRGVLHDADGVIGAALWRHPHWVACRLAFKNHHREILRPGTWTELFFLDEAVAFAAGHRPCAYCRRADYRRFVAAWRAAHALGAAAPLGFRDIDRVLHAARVVPRLRRRRTYEARLGDLPFGTFVERDGAAWLVGMGRLLRWTHFGYDRSAPIDPAATVVVVTPAPTIAVFGSGYVPDVHESGASAPLG